MLTAILAALTAVGAIFALVRLALGGVPDVDEAMAAYLTGRSCVVCDDLGCEFCPKVSRP